MNSPGQQHALDQMVVPIEQASSPLLRLEHSLVPLVSFLVLPLFALANAGVRLDGGSYASLADPVAVGVIVGLFLGKQLGITLFAWIAVRFGIADLPREVSWRGIHGVGCLAGIGFTMSLFISGLALEGGLGETAKVGILVGSLILGVTGWLVLRGVLRAPAKNVAGSATPTSS
jgi:NhaA family Na+:H+ antiporter